MLLACEALLLGRPDDATVLDERRRTIVVESRQTENAHPVLHLSQKMA